MIPHISAIRCLERPDQNRNPRNWHNDALSHEQPAEIIRMHAQKWQTDQPEDEKADHGIRLDTLTLRNRVLEGQERRPNRTNHDLDAVRPVHVLDREPENAENRTRNDGQVRSPETPGCACKNWEGDVVNHANGTVQGDYEGDDEEGEGYDAERLAPCQADCDDAGRELPCCSAG